MGCGKVAANAARGKIEEKRKKDKKEIQKRFADVERRQAEEREADKERK